MQAVSLSSLELRYLEDGRRRLGRVATADAAGRPQVTPVGMWRYNPETGTIDVTGRSFEETRKYRNVQVNPFVAFVVDDLASTTPWRPRAVIVEGGAEALDADGARPAMIRVTPERVISWGLDG